MGFLLTILAGFSTMLGTVFLFKKNNKNIIPKSLAFAAGVMITVSIIDLIPESFNLLRNYYNLFETIIYILIYITLGIIISMTIDKYLPFENGLYRVGVMSMIAIILHNIPEGIATFITTNSNLSLGISLAIAIALHNIPEGISISIPIYHSTGSKSKAILFTFISSISEPFGALLAYTLLTPIINNNLIGSLYSIIAGIMIHISMYELIPNSFKTNKKIALKYITIGTIFMIISLILIKVLT